MEIGSNTELVSRGGSVYVEQRYSRREAADYLGISVVTIDRALKNRSISCFRVGRRVIFSKAHLDEFLSSNECRAKVRKNGRKPAWFSANQELAIAE